MKKYDVIIIGAGPSGIFCACRLKELHPDMKILMIEKGRSIEDRSCPKRVTKECVGCRPCSITTGFAGAGAFSDGKLSLSPDVGGTLPEILGYDRTQELIRRADEIYLKFGADKKVYGIDDPDAIDTIRAKAIRANLKLIECPSAIWGRKKATRSTQDSSSICWTWVWRSCSAPWSATSWRRTDGLSAL